jgi:hypothetical protein
MLDQCPDNLVDVSAGTEIVSGSGEYHHLHVAGAAEHVERLTELAI